jgi:hypothetical protein
MKGGDLLWRGTEKRVKDIKIFTPRTDRRPRDTDEEVHKYVDDYFNTVHGWKARSMGVFTTNNRYSTKQYGRPYVFFPIGKYKYLWNPEVKDLKAYMPDQVSDFGFDVVAEGIMRVVEGYKNTNLKQATVRDSEVMFLCKSYYLVDSGGPNLYQQLEELLD